MKFWEEALTLPHTEVAEEIFKFKDYSTMTLVLMLASEISVMADNPRRLQLLEEWENKALCRGDICRMLAARGVTLSKIHFRKS